jgi:cyclic pyranopterin phosphate synthase
MPFVNLILEPDGSVGFCRQKGTEFTFGNIKDRSIWDLWNCEGVQNWRQEFLSGNVQICKQEIRDRMCNNCSQLNTLQKQLIPQIKMPNRIKRLTANLNGACNLKCQMCNVWKLPNGFYTEENFWRPASLEIFPYLEEVDMLSGEPFIQADTFRLINSISKINPTCRWSFTTNAHWKLTSKVKDCLNQIDIKNIIISVDSFIPEIYYKVRFPGNLHFVLENINRLIVYNDERISQGLSNLNLALNFLVQKDNWLEVKNVIKFCLTRNIKPFITFLYEPSTFSLLTLPEKEREKILHYYLEELSVMELAHLRRVVMPLINSSRGTRKYEHFYLLATQSQL